MQPERWVQIEELCLAALDRAEAQRALFLDAACAGDKALREEVESLLEYQETAKSFIEAPALEVAAKMAAADQAWSLVGHQINHYRILALLGAGGMGKVYLAEDLTLRRRVALKLLPAEFTRNPDRVLRFKQEARAISALNHPNILTIYEIGEVAGTHYIATEFIDGQTLRQRLISETMPIGDVVDVAAQVAGALVAAHDSGVVHRDIKPENIMVRKDGLVKVLDFGLAKLTEFQMDGVDSRTVTNDPVNTQTGALMGTVRYMSPEQARGTMLDARSDIFSLGVVLHEMLAGKSPFAGATTAEIIAAILGQEPPATFSCRPEAPEALGRIVMQALRKEVAERYQTALQMCTDLKELKQRLEIDAVYGKTHAAPTPRGYIFEADIVKNGAGTENAQISSEIINGEEPLPVEAADAPSVVTGSPNRSTVRRFAPWVGLTLLTVAAISVLLALYPSANTSPSVWRAVPLTTYPGAEVNPALSPDNSRVAFTWNGEKQDNFDIYVQPIGPGRPQRLTTDPAQDTSPAWSPQGDKIAFLRRINGDRNHLVLIPAFGGPEQIVAETRSRVLFGTFGSDLRKNLAWTPDGHWIVAQHRETEESLDGLYLFSVSMAEKRLMSQSPMGYFDENPAFSPSGDAITFARHVSKNASELYVVALSKDFTPSGSARRLTSEGGSASHPVWTKDGSRIIYRLGSELRVVDSRNSDASERIPLEAGNITELSLERDLVYSQALSDTNIYRAEIPSPNGPLAVPHLLISSTREDSQPRYSPIGKAIAFRSARSGAGEIWISNADGSNPVQVTSFGPPFFPNWSPDGKRFVFHARPDGHGDIFSVAASGGPPKRLTSDPSEEILASYSHDGHWIYFSSSRSGQLEIWKMPADGGDATRLTIGGGTMPVESPDGKTVFYARSKGTASTIWKIPVAGGEAVQVTGPIAKDPAFAVSMQGIYYVIPPESPTRQLIQFLDFATSQSRPVVVADREIGLGMSLSPDGRFLIFAQRDQVGRDLMLIRDFGVRN